MVNATLARDHASAEQSQEPAQISSTSTEVASVQSDIFDLDSSDNRLAIVTAKESISNTAQTASRVTIYRRSGPPAKEELTFLRVPREIRDQIYSHFLTVNRGLGDLFDRTIPPSSRLVLLRVSRQVKAEALEVLRTTNLWIQVAVHADPTSTVDLYYNLRHDLAGILRLARKDMEPFTSNHLLCIEVDEGGGKTIDSGLRRPRKLTFPYNRELYSYFCHRLFFNANLFRGMTVAPRARPGFPVPRVARELLLPLKIVRGIDRITFSPAVPANISQTLRTEMLKPIETWSDIAKILQSFMLEGNLAFKEGNYLLAAHSYRCGNSNVPKLLDTASALHLEFLTHEGNEIMSLRADMDSNLTLSLNKLVEKFRTGKDREIEGLPVTCLDQAIEAGYTTLTWMGLLNKQRAKAHHRVAVALQNRADYEMQITGSNVRYIRNLLEEAAAGFFFAARADVYSKSIDKKAEEIENRLGRGSRISNLYPLANVSLAGGFHWRGDKRLIDRWGPFFLEMVPILQQRISKEECLFAPEDGDEHCQ